MTKGLRFTEEAWRQIAARNSRWQRGTMLPVVGEANANDSAGPPRVEGGASQEKGRSEPKSTVVARDKYRSGQDQRAKAEPPAHGAVAVGAGTRISAASSPPVPTARQLVASIPTLTDAVAGPGLTKRPYKRRKASAVPYFQQLTALLRPLQIPDPIPEYLFAKEIGRKYRADFCWPKPVALILEIQGGLWIEGGGRHNRAAGYLADMARMNTAVLLGYRVLQYGPDQLDEAARDVATIFGR